MYHVFETILCYFIICSLFPVMSDEKGDLEVRVCIVLPGLKKKFGKNEPSNAEKLVVKTKEQ